MITVIVSILEKLGLTPLKVKVSILLILAATSSFYVSKYQTSLQQKDIVLVGLVESFDRVERKIDSINCGIVKVESQVQSMSKGTEKIAEAQMSLFKTLIKEDKQMMALYDIKKEQVKEYEEEYLPHNIKRFQFVINKNKQ